MRDSDSPKRNKILIITSSGGGGLLQVARAKEQEVLAKNPHVVIARRDLLKDWLGRRFGGFCAQRYNAAQVTGNITALRFFIASQRFMDYFCWPHFFFCALYSFFKEGVDHVIDTQPIGTSAIVKALRLYNAVKKKHIVLQKVLVDLPTESATHYFRPIKSLTKRDRAYLQLVTIAPLLKEGQTPEAFWQKTCRLSDQEIHYEGPSVREAFRKLQHLSKPAGKVSLTLRYKSEEEREWMERCWQKGGAQVEKQNSYKLKLLIPSEARVITILLGSQPASEATIGYVQKWLQLAKQADFSEMPCYLFVFCAEYRSEKATLFHKVVDAIDRCKKYPEGLTIVPFSFQDDDVIAPLFHRSDVTCTRSGGATAMELMALCPKEIWIHSETKGDHTLSTEELLKGIPGWEAANALYLQKLFGAKIVTPESFAPYACRLLKGEERGEKEAPLPTVVNGSTLSA